MNILENILASKQLLNCMHRHKFILTFLECTTIYKSQLDHNIYEIILF
jgi:hypothetical protein